MPDSLEDNVSCRICMDSKDNYVSLFSHDLSKKVMEIADVQVEKDDGLPDTICTECETDLEKCYEFRLKVQVSDKKFRDHITFSQVNIEECNIKEERYMDDGNSDNNDDREDSVSMDEGNCNDGSDDAQKNSEENEVTKPDPLNHVVVVEEKDSKVKMSEDPLLQEVMIEESQVKKIEETSVDPLVCMKEEAEIMDVDSNQPETFGPSSSVNPSESSKSQTFVPSEAIKVEGGPGQTKDQSYLHCRQVTSNNSLVLSTLYGLLPSSSVTPVGLVLSVDKTIVYTKLPTSVNVLMPEKPKCHQNVESQVKSVSERYIKTSNFAGVTNLVKNLNPTPDGIQLKDPIMNKQKEEGSFHSKSKFIHAKKKLKTEKTSINKKVNNGTRESSDHSKVQSPGLSADTVMPFKKNVKPKNESFCWVCNVSCGSIELLQEHKERKEFICRTCTLSFDNHVELETHFTSHTPYRCKTCGEVFHFKKDLFRHRISENCMEPLNYSCVFCNKKFLRNAQLRQHLWTHNKVKEGEGEMCIVCKKKFSNSHLLMAHGKAAHSVFEHLECDTCHKLLLGPRRLRCHIQTVHIEPTEDAQFPCSTCGKILTNKSSLNAHIVEKHDDTQYVCEICGQSVMGKRTMEAHIKNKHPKQKFICTLCNEQFDSKTKLSTHRKRHNRKERPPKTAFCEICGKTYKTEQILKTHLQVHSDEKPFICEICGAAFKQKATLRTHIRVHNSVGKYTCSECGLSFNWKQTFEKHVTNCEGSSARDDDTDSS